MVNKVSRLFTSRNLLIVFGAIIVVIGGVVLSQYLSKRTVSFELASGVKSVNIIDEASANSECGSGEDSCHISDVTNITLEKSSTIRLADGIYYVTPAGDGLSDANIKITIDHDDAKFTIDPSYSDDKLADLLKDEIRPTHQVILDKYPLAEDYIVDDGTLYRHGDWYVTSLVYASPEPRIGADTFYVILHKVSDKWQIAASPDLYFRYSDHKDIPVDIIDAVNRNAND